MPAALPWSIKGSGCCSCCQDAIATASEAAGQHLTDNPSCCVALTMGILQAADAAGMLVDSCTAHQMQWHQVMAWHAALLCADLTYEACCSAETPKRCQLPPSLQVGPMRTEPPVTNPTTHIPPECSCCTSAACRNTMQAHMWHMPMFPAHA